MSRERIRPMPTAEQKARARFKMASADPFAWAMKSVDDKFPDSREKSEKTLREEAEVEAMVRRILAEKQMARRATVANTTPVNRPAVAARVAKTMAPEPVAKKPVVPVTEKAVVEETVVEKTAPEKVVSEEVATEKVASGKTATEKAIEEAFEDGEVASSDDFDDYDDIEGMEGGFSDDEPDNEEVSEPVDGGIMDEDMMKSEILDEDLLGDELGVGDEHNSEPEIMDDFDDEPVEGEASESVTEAEADETTNSRPVNMVLGKKAEESADKAEETGEEKVSKEQDIRDEIRAKQMDFEAESGTHNPLIDDGKPTPEIKKVEPAANTPKERAKIIGAEARQKKMLVGIVALAVLALGGVLFGVIAMINQGKASEELAQQMAAVVSGAASSSDNVDSEYIYLKDWGMKIKIISGLTDVSYNVANDDYPEVLIWGAKKDSSVPYTPDFARQAKNSSPLGTVVRVARYERAAAGRLIWYDDYYNYYYQGPSGIPSVSESEMNWWVESYLLIKEMLTNADNYMTMEETNTIGQQQ